MKRHARLLPALLAALALLAPAAARAGDVPDAVAKKEQSALRSYAGEVLKLAKACAAAKQFGAARAELERGLRIAPDAKALSDELEKLEGKEDDPKASGAAKLDEKREKGRERCAEILADLAVACDKAKAPARWTLWVDRIAQEYPAAEKPLAKTGAKWYEPYLGYVRAADLKRLEAGDEELEGKWLAAAEVEKLDARHASWSDPWVLADEVHEVRTTLPLRTAKRLLAHIGAFRRFFLAQVADGWELRPPAGGKLPVIVTADQADLRARTADFGPQATALADAMQGAAYYMYTNGDRNPCFVTFEPKDVTGRTTRVTFEQVLFPLQHEITHQIAFEYSKHDADRRREPADPFWSIEGVANYFAYFKVARGQWRLSHPRLMPLGEGFTEGAFAWTQAHEGELPALADFFAIPRAQFMRVENYHIAATLAYFLAEGEKGRYRTRLWKLLERVHRVKSDADTFGEIFQGVDMGQLEKEWRAFVRGLKIEG